MRLICNRCKERYSAGRPANFASDPQCGFDEEGQFTPDNWQCETLGQLRDAMASAANVVRSGETSVGVLPIDCDGRLVVLSWYKNRGATGQAVGMNEDEVSALTLTEAEECLARLRRAVGR